MTHEIVLCSLCSRTVHTPLNTDAQTGKREFWRFSSLARGSRSRRTTRGGTKEWKEGRTRSTGRARASDATYGREQRQCFGNNTATRMRGGAENYPDRCRFWCHRRKRGQLDELRRRRQRWRVTVTSGDDRWLVTGTLPHPRDILGDRSRSVNQKIGSTISRTGSLTQKSINNIQWKRESEIKPTQVLKCDFRLWRRLKVNVRRCTGNSFLFITEFQTNGPVTVTENADLERDRTLSCVQHASGGQYGFRLCRPVMHCSPMKGNKHKLQFSTWNANYDTCVPLTLNEMKRKCINF